jgi:hypothetical protein
VWENVTYAIAKIYSGDYDQTFTPAHNYFLPECEKPAADGQEIFNREMDKLL